MIDAADDFIDTAVSPQDVQPNQMLPVNVNGRKLILTRVDDQIVAFDSRCPHAAADLSLGTLTRWKVTCPDHDYCFDVRNGRVLWPEDGMVRLKRYPVRINGSVWVQLAAAPR